MRQARERERFLPAGADQYTGKKKGKGAFIFAVVLSLCATDAFCRDDSFNRLWYDGNAEISTYKLFETRYGELREGIRVMVFVTEPLRLSTLIKPDTPLPDELQVKVIKLNDLRRFPTGIYKYAVMTSVFAAVEEKPDIPRGATMKVAFSSQEWCGTVFERYVRRPDRYDGHLFSYFESEGEAAYIIPHKNDLESEENLWLMVRELQGPVMEEGARKTMQVIPSLWSKRKTHTHSTKVTATVRKGGITPISTALGPMRARTFDWEIDGKKTVVLVEAAYPHRILSWTERDGSEGFILASRREPYWKENANQFQFLRDELKISCDEGGPENGANERKRP